MREARWARRSVSGRLGGAEIARIEKDAGPRPAQQPPHQGRLRQAEAKTSYGVIGVKVWIFKGEVFDKPRSPWQVPRRPPRAWPRAPAADAAAEPPPRSYEPEGVLKEFMTMMQPKRTKYRKQFKGRNSGLAPRGSDVSFGEFGLKATSGPA